MSGSLWEPLGASGSSWEPLGQQQQQQQQHYPVKPYKALQGDFKGGPVLLPSPPAAPDTVLILPRILAISGARKVRDPGQKNNQKSANFGTPKWGLIRPYELLGALEALLGGLWEPSWVS